MASNDNCSPLVIGFLIIYGFILIISHVGNIWGFFFFIGHSNESCNLFTRSVFSFLCLRATERFCESPNTSLLSLPFFINISRFSGRAVFLSKYIDHYLRPINNLLILPFLSLKSLWLTEKYWFQNEFVEAIVSLRWLTSGLKTVRN